MSPLPIRIRPFQRPPAGALWRHLLAHLSRRASEFLARRARQVARPLHERQRSGQHDVTIEFHAEAGAPEGALYVDGQLVGYVDARRL